MQLSFPHQSSFDSQTLKPLHGYTGETRGSGTCIRGRGFAHHVKGPQFDPQCKQKPFREMRDEGPRPRVFLT